MIGYISRMLSIILFASFSSSLLASPITQDFTGVFTSGAPALSRAYAFNQYSGPDTLVSVELTVQLLSSVTVFTNLNATPVIVPFSVMTLAGTDAFTSVTGSDGASASGTEAFSVIQPIISNTFSFANLSDFVGNGLAGILFVSLSTDPLVSNALSTGTDTLTLSFTTEPAVDNLIPIPPAVMLISLGLLGMRFSQHRKRA